MIRLNQIIFQTEGQLQDTVSESMPMTLTPDCFKPDGTGSGSGIFEVIEDLCFDYFCFLDVHPVAGVLLVALSIMGLIIVIIGLIEIIQAIIREIRPAEPYRKAACPVKETIRPASVGAEAGKQERPQEWEPVPGYIFPVRVSHGTDFTMADGRTLFTVSYSAPEWVRQRLVDLLNGKSEDRFPADNTEVTKNSIFIGDIFLNFESQYDENLKLTTTDILPYVYEKLTGTPIRE